MVLTKTRTALIALAFLGVMLLPLTMVHADATSTATSTDSGTSTSTATTTSSTSLSGLKAMIAQIQALLAQIHDLQSKLAGLRGQVQTTVQQFRTDIRMGMQNSDIKSIQELLASDPSLYPEGLTTGYFGPLTQKALERFQERHGLNPTGEVDEDTNTLLQQYLGQRFGSTTPPGLLRAPGIEKKVTEDLCTSGEHATGPLCKTLMRQNWWQNGSTTASTTMMRIRDRERNPESHMQDDNASSTESDN